MKIVRTGTLIKDTLPAHFVGTENSDGTRVSDEAKTRTGLKIASPLGNPMKAGREFGHSDRCTPSGAKRREVLEEARPPTRMTGDSGTHGSIGLVDGLPAKRGEIPTPPNCPRVSRGAGHIFQWLIARLPPNLQTPFKLPPSPWNDTTTGDGPAQNSIRTSGSRVNASPRESEIANPDTR